MAVRCKRSRVAVIKGREEVGRRRREDRAPVRKLGESADGALDGSLGRIRCFLTRLVRSADERLCRARRDERGRHGRDERRDENDHDERGTTLLNRSLARTADGTSTASLVLPTCRL